MARDFNDARQNKRLEQLGRERDRGDDEALKTIMRTEDGRRVLSRLAREFGWMGEVWDSQSARQTDYNAGRQSAGRHLMTWAERVAPAEFLTAIGEATRRDVETNTLAAAATIEKDEHNG